MQKSASGELPRREPLVVRFGDGVYRRIGAVWVDRRFVVVNTMLASRLDKLAYLQAVQEAKEQPHADRR